MKLPIQKVFLLVIGVAIMSSAGCQEQELPSEKKSRLIAAENIELKKQLEQRNGQIEQLKKQHEKQIQQQEDRLAKCLKRKETVEKQLREGVKEQVDDVLSAVVEENAKLREEIKNLKAEIEKLRQ